MELTLNIDDSRIDKIISNLEEGRRNRPMEYMDELTGYWKYYLSRINVKKVGPNRIHITGASGFYFPGMTYSGLDRINTIYKRFGLMRKIKGSRFDLSIPQNNNIKFGYKVSNKWISVDFLRSIYYAKKIITKSEGVGLYIPDSPRILEIGSGTGIQALVFKLLYHKSIYLMVDLPETLALAQVFLSAVLPKSNFLFFDDWKKNQKLLSDNTYDFIFIPNYAISQIQSNSINLAINTHSMQEMNYKTIHLYFNEIRRVLEKPFLFYQCNRNKIMDKTLIEVEKYPYRSTDTVVCQGKDEFLHKSITMTKIFNRLPIIKNVRVPILKKGEHLLSLTKMSK